MSFSNNRLVVTNTCDKFRINCVAQSHDENSESFFVSFLWKLHFWSNPLYADVIITFRSNIIHWSKAKYIKNVTTQKNPIVMSWWKFSTLYWDFPLLMDLELFSQCCNNFFFNTDYNWSINWSIICPLFVHICQLVHI